MKQVSRQTQTQTQRQVQTLSPQQIMVVKLIELPTLELEERVRAELLENPALEEGVEETHLEEKLSGEDSSNNHEDNEYDALKDYLTEDDIPDYKLREPRQSYQNPLEEIPFADSTSFYEILQTQLGEQKISDHQRKLGEYLIGSLDDDGLLRKPLSHINDELAIYANIETTNEELLEILNIIQSFDPPGIGARNLQECLLIQINRQKDSSTTKKEKLLISDFYEEFTKKHWTKIVEQTGWTRGELNEIVKEITKLNPRPGAALGETVGHNTQPIIPDFIVDTYDDGEINLSLNNKNTPQLRISQSFKNLADEHIYNKKNQNQASKDALVFMKQKIDSAQGFIDAIKQRQNTLMSTMHAIIEWQKTFFLTGDETQLRPMILKDIAKQTDLDISTISRVSNSKYVQTNHGIFPLKFFFNDSYTTKDGEEMSVREIKIALQKCVDEENKRKPLTDDALADLLEKQGYPIARRTVAKYRQQLNIPVARLRKSIK